MCLVGDRDLSVCEIKSGQAIFLGGIQQRNEIHCGFRSAFHQPRDQGIRDAQLVTASHLSDQVLLGVQHEDQVLQL